MANMTSPKYSVNSITYLRESAALGFVEAVLISGVHLSNNGWLYTINASMSPPTPGGFNDRRSLVNTQVLYYSESEFVTHLEALLLAEANAKMNYDRIRSQRLSLFPDTTGTN